MTDTVLHYVYDPLCGWCYAAAPMVDAVASAGLSPSLHGGGLWQAPTSLEPEKAAYIRENDARITSVTGQPFGAAYLDGLLADPATVFWSEPTVAAVLAAERVAPDAGLRMLHAIQLAHYVEGRHVIRAGTIAEIAASLDLDVGAFGEAFRSADAADHIGRTRDLMARLDLRGFPSFVLERGPELVRIPHERFYGSPAAFADHVRTLAERRVA